MKNANIAVPKSCTFILNKTLISFWLIVTDVIDIKLNFQWNEIWHKAFLQTKKVNVLVYLKAKKVHTCKLLLLLQLSLRPLLLFQLTWLLAMIAKVRSAQKNFTHFISLLPLSSSLSSNKTLLKRELERVMLSEIYISHYFKKPKKCFKVISSWKYDLFIVCHWMRIPLNLINFPFTIWIKYFWSNYFWRKTPPLSNISGF